MINKIIIKPNSLQSKILLFDEIDLLNLPDPRIVPLFGSNGIGKSTLLNAIYYSLIDKRRIKDRIIRENGFFCVGVDKNQLAGCYPSEVRAVLMPSGIKLITTDKKNIIKKYMNSLNNIRSGTDSAIDSEQFLNGVDLLSEGQSILYSAQELLKDIDNLCKNPNSNSSVDIIIILDEIDSGLSLDNIDFVMNKLVKLLSIRKDIQIFMSFNSPLILKYFPYVISMYDGNVLKLQNENDMLQVMKENKKMFDSVRNEEDGFPKLIKFK